jgi:hypothetical protein
LPKYCPKGKRQTNWKRTRIWAAANYTRGLIKAFIIFYFGRYDFS